MPVVMMGGHASIDTAVETTKINALDFLEESITLQRLPSTVDHALKHSEMWAAFNLSLGKLSNSPVIRDSSHKPETAVKRGSPMPLGNEVGSPFELVACHLRKNGTPQVEPAKTEHIVDTLLELLQKTTGGVLYVGDITQHSENIQNGIVFFLDKTDHYNVRIIVVNSRSNEEAAVRDGRLFELLSRTVTVLPPLRGQPDDIAFLVNQVATELTGT